MRRFVLFVVIAVAATACEPRRPSVQPSSPTLPPLELIGEYDISPLTTFGPLEPARFGGISGLAVDPSTNEVFGVSDDSVDSRVFVFRPITPSATPFTVDLHA